MLKTQTEKINVQVMMIRQQRMRRRGGGRRPIRFTRLPVGRRLDLADGSPHLINEGHYKDLCPPCVSSCRLHLMTCALDCIRGHGPPRVAHSLICFHINLSTICGHDISDHYPVRTHPPTHPPTKKKGLPPHWLPVTWLHHPSYWA